MKMKLSMKTPGFMMDNLFYLKTLTIITVSSIALQMFVLVRGTSEENTLINYESLELEAGELRVRATGKDTTEVLLNLLKNANGSGILPISETF